VKPLSGARWQLKENRSMAEHFEGFNSERHRATKGPRAAILVKDARATESKCAERINRLRKPAIRTKHTRKLADKLAGCHPDHPCNSQACPTCRSKAVRRFVRATIACFQTHGFSQLNTDDSATKHRRAYKSNAGRRLAFVTIIPLSRIPIGELCTSEKVQRFVRRLKRVLSDNNVSMAIFALDVSTHEHQSGKFAPHYKVHAHGFMFLDEYKKAAGALRQAFPNGGNVNVAVQRKEYKGQPSAITYLLKEPKKRSIRLDQPLKNRNWKVSNRLRSAQHVEILQWLDQLGCGGRLIVRGAGTKRIRSEANQLTAFSPRGKAVLRTHPPTTRVSRPQLNSNWH
jgi:hypothetical protein